MPCPRCNSEVVMKDGTTQLGGQRFRLRYGPLLAGPIAEWGEAGMDAAARGVGHSTDEWLSCWAAVRRFTFDQFDEAQTLIESL